MNYKLKSIHFQKYHGAGNDFIMADARNSSFIIPGEEFIRKMCDRHFGIGADGIMFLQSSPDNDFRMKYFNSDGREGTMCGNGGRCIVAFARHCGIIKDHYAFEAIDGIHTATYTPDGNICLKMNGVSDIVHFPDGIFADTGSPHFIIAHPSPHQEDMNVWGKKYRYDTRFGQGGANVNLIYSEGNTITIATFERGVEAETLACGTGAVAAAIAVAETSDEIHSEYAVKAKGGQLHVHLKKESGGSYSDIYLTGPAEFVFSGEILFLP